MARKRATLTDLLNDLTFKIVFDKFKILATSSFEWSGLPEGIKEKYIEQHLFNDGKAIFFRPEGLSYNCLMCSDGGKYNINGEPLYYFATGVGFNKQVKADDCVIIENNPLRLNTYDFVMFYVNKITEVERTMDVNVKSVKTPTIFACDDKDVLTFKRLFNQVDGNVPAIFADKGLNLDGINAYDTKVKFLCNDLMDYKKSVENELLTFLGYDNLAVDKKERVNLSEANSNNQITKSFAELQLESRKLACDIINEKYGLNISVKRREVEEDVEKSTIRHDEADDRAS